MSLSDRHISSTSDMYIGKLSWNILYKYIRTSQNYKLNIQLVVVARKVCKQWCGGACTLSISGLLSLWICVVSSLPHPAALSLSCCYLCWLSAHCVMSFLTVVLCFKGCKFSRERSNSNSVVWLIQPCAFGYRFFKFMRSGYELTAWTSCNL